MACKEWSLTSLRRAALRPLGTTAGLLARKLVDTVVAPVLGLHCARPGLLYRRRSGVLRYRAIGVMTVPIVVEEPVKEGTKGCCELPAARSTEPAARRGGTTHERDSADQSFLLGRGCASSSWPSPLQKTEGGVADHDYVM